MNWTENCKSSSFISYLYENYNFFKVLFIASTCLYVVLGILASCGNGLIIVAILRSKNLNTPSYFLITSLAFTDFVAGLIYYPYFCLINVFLLNKETKAFCGSDHIMLGLYYFSIFLIIISLVMNAFISIDRYLALSLRHRYRIYVTKNRVRVVIVSGWLGVFVSLGLMIATRLVIRQDIVVLLYVTTLVIINCIFYGKSFMSLHRYTSQVRTHQPNPIHGNFDVGKYRKTLKTMIAILICLLASFVPSVITAGLIFFYGLTRMTLAVVLLSLISYGANSVINPVIYLTRFSDIRQECRNVLRKVFVQREAYLANQVMNH